jgi:serine protease Do
MTVRGESFMPNLPGAERHVRRAAVGLAFALALALPLFAPAPAAAQRGSLGPDGIADLVEQTLESVVTINTTARVETGAGRTLPIPPMPPGAPFREWFEEFFGPRGEGQPQQPERRGEQQPAPGQPGQPGPQGPRRGNSVGSGFVIDASGLIVTNNHVIENADEIFVVLSDGQRLRATLIGRDAPIDLALLRVEVPAGRTLRVARFGDSDRVRLGEWVVAIGNPLNIGITVTAGILSARGREIGGRYDEYLQTDAPINRGNSGGPLFNMRGEVIGVNTAIASPTGGSIGIGFAIPSNRVQQIVAQLRDGGEVRRGWLGVQIQNVTDEIAQGLRMDRARGALVGRVTPDGPAAQAGIQTGDVITRFGDREVAESRDLPRIVADTPVGRQVPVIVFRRGGEQTVTVTVGRLDEAELQRNASVNPQNRNQPAPAPQARPVLGMALSGITAELRRQYRLQDDLRGVVVTRVEPGSPAAERGIQAGNVIVEVAQEAVSSPQDVQRRLEALQREGRRVALILVANAQGELRFVTLNTAQ